MIIPVRCFTCGNILGSKYQAYKEFINAKQLVIRDDKLLIVDFGDEIDGDFAVDSNGRKQMLNNFMIYLDKKLQGEENLPEIPEFKTIEARIFQELGIKRYCCKRHFIGHVDILEKL